MPHSRLLVCLSTFPILWPPSLVPNLLIPLPPSPNAASCRPLWRFSGPRTQSSQPRWPPFRCELVTLSNSSLFFRSTDAPRCRNPQTNTLVFSSIERAIDVPCDVDASPGKDVHFSWTVKNVSATQPKPLKDFVVNGELFCLCVAGVESFRSASGRLGSGRVESSVVLRYCLSIPLQVSNRCCLSLAFNRTCDGPIALCDAATVRDLLSVTRRRSVLATSLHFGG